MSKIIETTCNTCKTEIKLDFGEYTYEEAHGLIQKMDNFNRECPGYHVEFGGWRKRWNLDEALDKAYSTEEKSDSSIAYFTYIQSEVANPFRIEGYDADFEIENHLNRLKDLAISKQFDLSKTEIHFVEKNRMGQVISEEKHFLINL